MCIRDSGQVISHEISQKDYDKFLAVDDYHRMKLFSKIFNEVDLKKRPEAVSYTHLDVYKRQTIDSSGQFAYPLAECLVTYLFLLIGGCRYGRKYNVGA